MKRSIDILITLAVISLAFLAGGVPSAERDRITSLPGQPDVEFKQYAGYVTVDEIAGRALFYWLTESANDPSKKPLVIWLNGGPGCSSLAYGASEEIGPFKINKTASGLHLNPYSWNLAANMLFIESPAGVGFSYTNRSSDIFDSGDRRTAKDSLKFIINWLAKFPQYKTRELYITGESYAGHYVPQLAQQIIIHNSKESKHRHINLKGIMVGNACIDNHYDNLGLVLYWWSHAMISDQTYQQLMHKCDFRLEQMSSDCTSLFNYALDKQLGDIDQYSIYEPKCNHRSDGGKAHTRASFPRFRHLVVRRVSGYDPCTENYAELYYNRRDVQKSLHANTTGISYRWTSCSETLIGNWTDSELSMLPTYKLLIRSGLRLWVYSGDTDSVVPVTSTRFSLALLKLPVTRAWHPWYVKGQVAGWTETYKGLNFATVRGAGHEVPQFKPEAALQLFMSFLNGGEALPES